MYNRACWDMRTAAYWMSSVRSLVYPDAHTFAGAKPLGGNENAKERCLWSRWVHR